MTIPRRIDINRMSLAELAIRNAIVVVEEAGADPLLTDAVVLLGEAKEKVADWVDREIRQSPALSDREQFLKLIGQVRSNGATPDGPLLAVYDALQDNMAFLKKELASLRDHITFMQGTGTNQVNTIRDLKTLMHRAKADLYNPSTPQQLPTWYELEKALA